MIKPITTVLAMSLLVASAAGNGAQDQPLTVTSYVSLKLEGSCDQNNIRAIARTSAGDRPAPAS